jgi:hypothetical protein
LETTGGIFGGWQLPTDGEIYRVACGSMAGGASNVLNCRYLWNEELEIYYWSVTSHNRALADHDVTWVKYGYNAGRWIGCNFASGDYRWTFLGEPAQNSAVNVTNWQTIDNGQPAAEVRGISWQVTVSRAGTFQQYFCSALHNGSVARLHGPFECQTLGLAAIPGVELRASIQAGRIVLQARADSAATFKVAQNGFTYA